MDEERFNISLRKLLKHFGVTAQREVEKAVQALLTLSGELTAHHPRVAELALGVAWLVTTGRRTRAAIEARVAADQTFAALPPLFSDEQRVRAYVEQITA